MMPPTPTSGMRTARASSWTMRRATGLMAGPGRPPGPPARGGRGGAPSPAGALGELLGAIAPEVGDHPRPGRAQRGEAAGEEGLHADVLEADGVEHAARRLDQAGCRLAGRGPEREPLHGERTERAQVDQPGELDPVAKGAGSRDDGVRQPDRADRDARIDAGARAHRPPSRSSITIASWPGP